MNETTDLAVVESRRIVPWTPRFALTVDEAVALVDQKREFMKRVMREGEHFGTIPGTPKPTLYKPGAELLLSAMGLHSDSSINTVPPVVDLLGTDHGGEPFVMFQKTCEIYREEMAGERILIARASGNCSSWEKKYRYRKGERTCPACNKVGSVIKGKAEFGGGWLCWKNKGGCGTKFADNDKAITGQQVGEVPNPDIADVCNTVEKIAAKRALVAATLLATGCSDIFTQDLEDGGTNDDPPAADLDGVITPAKASASSQAAFKAAQDIARNSQEPDAPPLAEPDGETILPPQRGAQAVVPPPPTAESPNAAKRRGRPLGSKNGGKGESAGEAVISTRQVAPGGRSAALTTPASLPTAFGEEIDELAPLRTEIRQLASRLRKYQYMEQHRDLPPLEQWNREVERTLGIFIERKFGTEVVLDDVEEAGLREAIGDLKGYIEKYETPEVEVAGDQEGDSQPLGRAERNSVGSLPTEPSQSPPASDTTVVSLHKPIVRNPVAAQRRDDPTHIDPRAALDRARLVADLRNRTTALLATKEGLINLSAKDEERLRGQADKTMESAAMVSFGKAVKELDNAQLETLVARAKAATR